MAEPLEIGVSKYEIAIFLDDRIEEIFRTDSEQCQSTILDEAKRRMEYLRKEYPDRKYRAESVPKGMQIKNARLIHL